MKQLVQAPSSTHTPSLNRMRPTSSMSQKHKGTRAGNSYHDNSQKKKKNLKKISKNLTWTKLHPPTKFEPCAPSHFREEARTNKLTKNRV